MLYFLVFTFYFLSSFIFILTNRRCGYERKRRKLNKKIEKINLRKMKKKRKNFNQYKRKKSRIYQQTVSPINAFLTRSFLDLCFCSFHSFLQPRNMLKREAITKDIHNQPCLIPSFDSTWIHPWGNQFWLLFFINIFNGLVSMWKKYHLSFLHFSYHYPIICNQNHHDHNLRMHFLIWTCYCIAMERHCPAMTSTVVA